jgi:O-antigen ligase
VVWVVILGSRPVSFWFGAGIQIDTPDDYLEGSAFDRNVFLFLIVAGFVVLSRRRANWHSIVSSNRWLFLFYLYLAVSALWSDYTFVSFKRWVKDFGNVVMVLVVLTEENPIEAVKTVFARCTYLLIPLSVLFIRYYPDLGRTYNRWTWVPSFTGVTLEKNALGSMVLVCALFLVWDFLGLRDRNTKATNKTWMFTRLVLLLMVLWLLVTTHSSTSLACAILGTGILIGMRVPMIRCRVKHLGVYSVAAVVLCFLLKELLVPLLGRDMTLTGRTDIWKLVLGEKINPLVGVGFYSFWLGPRVDAFWEKYYFHLNEAHNGYLDTYLNSGAIGVCLLAVLLVSAGKGIKKEIMNGSDYGAVRLAFLVITITYNLTESAFNRINLMWFVLLLVVLDRPRPPRSLKVRSERIPQRSPEETERARAEQIPASVSGIRGFLSA